ncbi:AAA family ATPase [Halovulum sp. GXIMD14793]
MILDFNSAPRQGASAPVEEEQPQYDRDEVRASLLGQLESVLGHLYPNGFADPKGLRFYIGDTSGSAGESLSVELSGQKAGLWHDFATGEGGDIFDLWAAARGSSSFRETIKDAGEYSGATSKVPRRKPTRKQPTGGAQWGIPTATYKYTDANGNLLVEVERYEWERDGKIAKAFRPWDVATRKFKHPEFRPLYNLVNVSTAPEIIVVEGEKAADALIAQNINATTAIAGSNAPFEKTDWSPLKGRMVWIWPDNDEPGHGYAERLKSHLEAEGALSVGILSIPHGKPEKWDAADAADEDLGSLIKSMRSTTSDTPQAVFNIDFWQDEDFALIPRVDYVYNSFYAKGYTSVTAAPPKVGKSLLGLVEAVDIATGRGILTGKQQAPQRVYYYNAEDDIHTIKNRIAAILAQYNIPQSELVGQLSVNSGVDEGGFYIISGAEGQINEAQFKTMEQQCIEHGIDCMILDPLQDLSRSPETNEVMRILGGRLRRMASRCQLAIGLIHHTRKMQPGVKASIDDMRGGSALRGTARFNRLLVPMSEAEAVKAGLNDHRAYFQVGDIEGNLAPPSSDYARWYEKKSIIAPNGESVGVIVPWQWPDAFDGISARDAARVRDEIDTMSNPPRADIRASAWVGNIVANVLGMNITKEPDKARVKSIVSKWVETDVLRVVDAYNSRAGRDVEVIVCGSNDPLEGGGS